MSCVTKTLLAVLFVLFAPFALASSDCNGKFPNLVSDICWSCSFPIKFGASAISLSISNDQEDTPSPGGAPTCNCGVNIGMKVSFWEPVRHIDVVRKPFCMSAIGVDMSKTIKFDAPHGSKERRDNGNENSFYQAHLYVDPIMPLLGAVLDSPCLEQSFFDVAYMTEFDPLWNDDELTTILNPDSFLFGNLAARLACGADCVAATIGFSKKELFWCAGCQGSMYPLNGHVAAHVGGVQASSLIMTRLLNKLHRQFMVWAANGEDGMCGYYPQFIMDKTNYKYQMHFPVAQNKINGKCCQPIGRSTVLWGAGKEIPNLPGVEGGEDFAYMIFRKRDCCQGAF